jgi:hypothetical protein
MSSSTYGLYLSRPARQNVDVGLAAGIWGLTDDAVRRRLEWLSTPMTGLDVLQALEVGDLILAAAGGPQPRVPRGGWIDKTVSEVHVWRVTAPYYQDNSAVWPAPPTHPAERYPHRFGIEEVELTTEVTRVRVGPEGMDAFHYSANIGGLPVPISSGLPLVLEAGELQPGQTDDPAFLAIDGDLDATALIAIRREQRKLRQQLLGAQTVVDCALCGRIFPVDCVRTAHIKKRSRCDEHERRDLGNIMRACALGCDHLFELGYVFVDSSGTITRSSAAALPEDLETAISVIEGRRCTTHDPASAHYFQWHRENL